MKKVVSTVLLILFVIGIGIYLWPKSRASQAPDLYQRTIINGQKVTKKRAPTPKELKLANLDRALHKIKPPTRVTQPPNAATENLPLLNSYASDWQEKLVDQLMQFQAPEVKVIVDYQRSLLLVGPKGLRYAEEVIVSYQNEKQLTGGFTALIDSQSGKIIKTWNRINWLIPPPAIELPEVN